MNCRRNKLILSCAIAAVFAQSSHATLNIVANSGATQVGNLITNGSFENTTGGGPSGNGFSNSRYWATGTTLNAIPFAVPVGWSSSGNANSYAQWGNDGGSPNRLLSSDTVPDGNYALYFGNGTGALTNTKPLFNMTTGEVTFSGNPTFTQAVGYPAPVTLSQTIPTVANPAPQYAMSFWASGEFAALNSDPSGNNLGIFGLQMTNVLPGDPLLYFAVPSASDNSIGASFVYDFFFSPINPLNNVSMTVINFGHFDLQPWGRQGTTELVLDDVRVNALVPEPASLGVIALGAVTMLARRVGKAQGRGVSSSR